MKKYYLCYCYKFNEGVIDLRKMDLKEAIDSADSIFLDKNIKEVNIFEVKTDKEMYSSNAVYSLKRKNV